MTTPTARKGLIDCFDGSTDPIPTPLFLLSSRESYGYAMCALSVILYATFEVVYKAKVLDLAAVCPSITAMPPAHTPSPHRMLPWQCGSLFTGACRRPY